MKDIDEKIIQLLDGDLENEEAEELKREIELNAEVKNDMVLYEKIMLVIRQKGEEELRSQLNVYLKDYTQGRRKVKKRHQISRFMIYGGIAATVLLVVSTYLWTPKPSDPQTLFMAYYQPYPSLVNVRSVEVEEAYASSNAYVIGDYNLALENYNKEKTKSDTLLFYKALSHLSLGQADSALISFQKISKKSIFIEQVTWYEALALLQKGDIDASKEGLKIIQPNEFKAKEAAQLINELKE